MNLEFARERVGGSKLVRDYLDGTGAAPDLFRGRPDDPESYRQKAREVDERFDQEARRRAVELVSVPEEADASRLERLVEEGGYFVTTGQQPGLFSGPIYSIYKALSAVGRARALQELLDRPVVPLFWVASEDHDWEEVARTVVADVDNNLREIVVSSPMKDEEPPLHRIVLEKELEEARLRLESVLPDTDFSSRYEELLRRAYAPGTTLPTAFQTVLEELLGPFGLCFVQAHEEGLKEASLPVLFRELEQAGEHEDILRERADALEAAGYHVQVPILENGVNLFLEGSEGRERLYRVGPGEDAPDDATDEASREVYRLHRSGAEVTRDEIQARVEKDPRVLTPNALLRPVVESTVFPTLSYVAGPGETAYFAQLSGLFERHGVGMPVVAPRCSMTVVEAKNRKVLDKFDLEISQLDRPFHELASEVARDEVPGEVRRALGSFRGAVSEHARKLLDAATDIDPTLKGPIENARSTAALALDDVEKKIVQAVKRQDEIALNQLEKVQVHLFPEGRPQERVMNVFYYLVRYGEDFLGAVAEECKVEL
ncbi:MAG: bacillithiol biosynthesis cysteine-adding enzyme BshC [Longimicrobiales bacterium]|nr:bacillithiol biosynthesis cysteine-adding enzyme BshC [Longimicrobiales bacterium]